MIVRVSPLNSAITLPESVQPVFSSIEPRLKVSSKFAVQLSDPRLGVLAFTNHGGEAVVQEILSIIKHSDYSRERRLITL
jgi:hypothetical protein